MAVTGAILIGLGFSPLAASGLSLIANTAPVAFGALGAPIQGLASVTGYPPEILGAMIGRQLPLFSLIVPFWLIWVFAGFRGMIRVWPPILVCGASFAVALPQATDQFHLHDIDRVHVRVAHVDGAAQHRVPVEQLVVPGDVEQGPAGAGKAGAQFEAERLQLGPDAAVTYERNRT